MRNFRVLLFISVLIVTNLLIVGCREENPTPDFILPTPTNTSPPPTVTLTPSPRPTSSPEPTETPKKPAATLTPLPTETSIPQVVIEVLNERNERPISGALIRLKNEAEGFSASYSTLENGKAYFTWPVPSETPYIVEVAAASFKPVTMELVVVEGLNELSIELERGATAEITTETVNLRAGPGVDFDVVVEALEGQILPVLSISEDGEWVLVLTDDELEGWVFLDLVRIDGDLDVYEPLTATPEGTPEIDVTPTIEATTEATPTTTVEATPEGGEATEGTPTSYIPPARPERINFVDVDLRADMDTLQNAVVQMGGILDSLALTGNNDCVAYTGYYAQVAGSQTYKSIPPDWVTIHNLYVAAINKVLDTNESIDIVCSQGGGDISPFNFEIARNGINVGLERLRDAIIAADERLAV